MFKLRILLIDFFLFVESVVFPLLFIYFAFQHWQLFSANQASFGRSLNAFFTGSHGAGDLMVIADGLRDFLFVGFNGVAAWGLVLRKKLVRRPESFSDIFYPFIGTFFYFAYDFLPHLPGRWNIVLVPKPWFFTCAIVGVIIANIGLVFSMVATYNLRKSFSVFIQVSSVVTRGLYRYVRHPIYFGYILSVLGVSLATPRLYFFLLAVVYVLITVKRAVLEERKITGVSDEYKSYILRTRFIIPAFFFRR